MRATGAILQGAGPVGYYLKVLKGVVTESSFLGVSRAFVTGRFVPGRFIPGISFLNPRIWAFPGCFVSGLSFLDSRSRLSCS